MMPVKDLNLFDANCRIGRYNAPGPLFLFSPQEILAEMDHAGIAEAMVYHAYGVNHLLPAEGNAALMTALRGHPRLHPVWLVTPGDTSELPPPRDLAHAMLAAGVRMGRLVFSASEGYTANFSLFLYDDLLAALAHHRIPLMLEFLTPSSEPGPSDWDTLVAALRAWPDLPLILAGSKLTMLSRTFYRLFDRYPNFYVELSGYQAHEGIADICRRFGGGRLLFGTGLPFYGPGQTVTCLAWADIGDADRLAIAGDTLRRLLKGVRS